MCYFRLFDLSLVWCSRLCGPSFVRCVRLFGSSLVCCSRLCGPSFVCCFCLFGPSLLWCSRLCCFVFCAVLPFLVFCFLCCSPLFGLLFLLLFSLFLLCPRDVRETFFVKICGFGRRSFFNKFFNIQSKRKRRKSLNAIYLRSQKTGSNHDQILFRLTPQKWQNASVFRDFLRFGFLHFGVFCRERETL